LYKLYLLNKVKKISIRCI